MRGLHGLLLAASALAVGCAHDKVASEPVANPQPPVIVERQPRGEAHEPIAADVRDPSDPLAVAENAGTAVAQAPEEALDDEKILKVAHVANEGAIEQARLAQRRAFDPHLRDLAMKMVKDNLDADRRAERIARVGKLNPQDSAISNALQQEGAQSLDQLANKDGREFDRAFIDGELDRQREMLRLIDDELLPNATRPEVRALVRSIRPEVVKRFDALRGLQDKSGK